MNGSDNDVLIYADFPDPCVLTCGDKCYVASTSMHYMPGIPLLFSADLQHWERYLYVYDQFEDAPAHHLQGGDIYGQGSWATSFVKHNGLYYICFNSNDQQKTYIYRTADLRPGVEWQRFVLPGSRHDPSLLFDNDRLRIAYCVSGDIYYQELYYEDTIAVKSPPQLLLSTPKVEGLNCEGAHWQKFFDYYYLLLIQWPKHGTARRIQWCYRAKELSGPYEGKVIFDEDAGFYNCGIAQGGFFEFKQKYYAMLFQDRGAIGRVPVLIEISWQEGWPRLRKENIVINNTANIRSLSRSDDFTSPVLGLHWQWNHISDEQAWSLSERKSHLRLKALHQVKCLEQAPNTLTQTAIKDFSSYVIKLDTSGFKQGTVAGLGCWHDPYAYLAAVSEAYGLFLHYVWGIDGTEQVQKKQPCEAQVIYLKMNMHFADLADYAEFFYSFDNVHWQPVREPFKMKYRLRHFVGNRPAIFCYTNDQTGGYADFDFFNISALKD